MTKKVLLSCCLSDSHLLPALLTNTIKLSQFHVKLSKTSNRNFYLLSSDGLEYNLYFYFEVFRRKARFNITAEQKILFS